MGIGLLLLTCCVQTGPPPTVALAVVDYFKRNAAVVVVLDSLDHELGPGVPIRVPRKVRLPVGWRAALAGAGVPLDGLCEGDASRCVFVGIQRVVSGGEHRFEVSTLRYVRGRSGEAFVYDLTLTVECPAVGRCRVVSARGHGSGDLVSMREYLRLRCTRELPTSRDSLLVEMCKYRKK